MFDRIEQVAQQSVAWRTRAIFFTNLDKDEGVILFEQASGALGTAHFSARQDEEPHFYWGHYDMSEQDAIRDFGERALANR